MMIANDVAKSKISDRDYVLGLRRSGLWVTGWVDAIANAVANLFAYSTSTLHDDDSAMLHDHFGQPCVPDTHGVMVAETEQYVDDTIETWHRRKVE